MENSRISKIRLYEMCEFCAKVAKSKDTNMFFLLTSPKNNAKNHLMITEPCDIGSINILVELKNATNTKCYEVLYTLLKKMNK